MKEKELLLLEYLQRVRKWITASELAEAVSCSVRSVKTYISNINSIYPNLILSSRKGFFISDFNKLADILNEKQNTIPQTANGRRIYILRKLLLENEKKELFDLADELCISPDTLNNELSKIRFELTDFDLSLKTKNNIAFIDGFEKNKKKLILHLIYEETKDFFNSLELIQSYLPDLDLKLVKHIISDTLLAHHYVIDDFSMSNIIIHIGILINRKLTDADNICSEREINDQNGMCIALHVTDLVNDLCSNLAEYFQIAFSENEIYSVCVLISTRLIRDNSLNYNIVINDSIKHLLEIIQNQVRNTFSLNLNNSDFIIRFSLHLKNMLTRLNNRIEIKNPQTLAIKNNYPLIYDVSVFIANIIAEECHVEVNEDEIAYISLHIGGLVEEQNALKHKLSAVFICPNYYSTQLSLFKKVQDAFESSLLLNNIISAEDELTDCRDYDIIISTIPLSSNAAVPFVMISSYFNNTDILNVATSIEYVKKLRLQKTLEHKLKFLFVKELFFYDPDFKDQNDVIEIMSDALQKQGYVQSAYKAGLYEREKISSCAYNNIAMPHPLDMEANKTTIAVSIHPSGLPWNDNKINFVFMLAINKKDNLLFHDIFDFITEILMNPGYLQTLLSASTYEEFIRLLVSYA